MRGHCIVATTKDYGLGDFDFPRGWFMIAEAAELREAPLALRFFGKDFALFRGASGRLVLLDAHCSHMGAHLAASTSASLVVHGEQIVGDSIRCPYHGWRFDHDGNVDDIPGYDGPCPKAAKLSSYRVKEVMGAIMMWHDPECGEPDFEFSALPEWDAPNWLNGAYDHLGCLEIHPQEILDNMADSNHLGPTHGSPCEYFENEFDGHLYFQRQGGFRREYDSYLMTYTWYTGPGLLLSRQAIGDIRSIEFIFHTPVDDGVTKVWHNNLLRVASEAPGEDDHAQAQMVQRAVLAAFQQDFDIWRNKKPAVRIMGLPTERNFQLGRIWYRQFYNPRNRVDEVHLRVNGKHVPTHKEQPPQISCELEGR
jgi:3-ketosteroid 9alpha-monooxygenase subunit A